MNVVSSFLARSLRQSVHERCEGEILKAVCLGQNLEVSCLYTFGVCHCSFLMFRQVRDNAYMLFREQGAFIQEPVEGAPPSDLPPPTHEEKGIQEKEVVVVDEVEVEDVAPQDLEKQSPRQGVGVIDGEVT